MLQAELQPGLRSPATLFLSTIMLAVVRISRLANLQCDMSVRINKLLGTLGFYILKNRYLMPCTWAKETVVLVPNSL